MSEPRSLRDELLAGLAAGIASIPFCLGSGLIAFAPLGATGAQIGPRAGLAGGIVAGAIAPLAGGARGQITAPVLAGAIVLAELVAGLAAGPAVAMAALTVLAAGLLQIGSGLLRLGRPVRNLARPIVAGWTLAVAVLTVRGQLPAFVAADAWGHSLELALAIGLGTAAIVLLSDRIRSRVPGPLAGLALGSLLAHLAMHATGKTIALIGSPPPGLPHLPDPAALAVLDAELAARVCAAAFAVALLSSSSSLSSARALDRRHDPDRELIAQGAGNVGAGLTGGLAGGGIASLSTLAHRSGGRGRLSGLAHAGTLLAFALVAGAVVGEVPRVVLAAIVSVKALRLFDPRLLRPSPFGARVVVDLGLALAIAATAHRIGLAAAILAGVAASPAHFAARAARVRIRRSRRRV